MGMPAAVESKSQPCRPLEPKLGDLLAIREIWELETKAWNRWWDADHVIVWHTVLAIGLTEPRVVGLDVVRVERPVAR